MGRLAGGFADFAGRLDVVQNFDMYKTEVTKQAHGMNKHNQMRCDMEKEGAVYRTYTILKHYILCQGGKATLADCTPELLLEQTKAKFNPSTEQQKQMYKKFDKLPITKAELDENLDAAKAMWVRKFVRKTKKKGHFAPKREEWQDKTYDLKTTVYKMEWPTLKTLAKQLSINTRNTKRRGNRRAKNGSKNKKELVTEILEELAPERRRLGHDKWC